MEIQKTPITDYNAWLNRANYDLGASRLCSGKELFDTSVFWAHDSAEKSLKAFLVFNSQEGDRVTHDLQKLTNQCVQFDDSFKTLLPVVEKINGWGKQVSYPDESGYFHANSEHCLTAISTAEKVYDFVKIKCAN